MFDRFSNEARRMMVLCQEEARKLRHNVITPHHLALGLLRLEEERGGGPLGEFGVDVGALREAIVAEAGAAMPTGPAGVSPPFTAESKRVLGDALKEALQLGDNFIGPGHQLLALLKAGTPAALGERVHIQQALEVVREDRRGSEFPGRGWGRSKPRLLGFVEVMKSAMSRSTPGAPAGSQHILLTLVARQDTLAGRILAELGVTEDKVRDLIDKIGPEGTLDEQPRPEYEVRIGEHSIRVDDPKSREMLRRILDEDPPLTERIRAAIERSAREGGN